MTIKITSKLSSRANRELRAVAKAQFEKGPTSMRAFIHMDRSTYAALIEPDGETELQQAHEVARYMMVCAGETFDYEVA